MDIVLKVIYPVREMISFKAGAKYQFYMNIL